MSTPPARWFPSGHTLLALAALAMFIIAALAYGNVITANAPLFLAVGLACLSALWVL